MTTIPIANNSGSTFNVTVSTSVQTALATQIATAANAAPAGSVDRIQNLSFGGTPLAVTLFTPYLYDIPSSFGANVITGAASVPSAQIILTQSGDSYTTGGTAVSTVVAVDNAPVTLINASAGSALLAATGAAQGSAGNTLEGLAGANQFITGSGGRDAVLLDGVVNSLTSNGNDVVLVGGPSTVAALAGGMDNVGMTAGTTLAFFNQSSSGTVDSITGAANGIVLLAGPGSTAITAGSGQEYFFLDTSAGNTTINANNSPTAALTFIKDLNAGTANVTVANFAQSGGIVAVQGYTSFAVNASATTSGSSVLSLSDGSQVTFNGLSTAALSAAVKVV